MMANIISHPAQYTKTCLLFGFEPANNSNEVASLLCQTEKGLIFHCAPGNLTNNINLVLNLIGKSIIISFSDIDKRGCPSLAEFKSKSTDMLIC